jgi:hypothetical protein
MRIRVSVSRGMSFGAAAVMVFVAVLEGVA